MVDEIQQLRADLAQVRTDLAQLSNKVNDFMQTYERRHGELSGRVAQVETLGRSFATREDVVKLTETLSSFQKTLDQSAALLQASLTQFETTAESMATKTDVDWLKRAFWAGVGAMLSIGGGLALHLLQTGLKP